MVVVKPLAIIAVLSTTAGAKVFESIQSLDFSILWSMHSLQTPWLTSLADVVSKLAWKGWLWWAIIIGCWFGGRKNVSAHMGIALLLSTVVGLPLKSIVARARPDLFAAQQLNIPMPELLSTEHSFPSGHTLLAAAFAFVVFKYWKDYRAWLAFTFVALVGLARIYLCAHWPSDVIGSAVLGALAAWAAGKIVDSPFIANRLKIAAPKKQTINAQAQPSSLETTSAGR
jgi:undecaprenyl-diphosphatase